MSDTTKHFRPPKPSPQPWKMDVERKLDLFEEFSPCENDTQEFLITEPDDYMDELSFEDAITEVHTRVESKT